MISFFIPQLFLRKMTLKPEMALFFIELMRLNKANQKMPNEVHWAF